jgi:hypothetical protein
VDGEPIGRVVSPVWWAVTAGLLLLAVVIAVTGYLRLRWLQTEELRAYAAEEPEPGVLTVTLTIDTRRFMEAMQRASQAMNDMAAKIAKTSPDFARLAEEMRWRAYLDRQLALAKASALIGVSAGVDPQYRTLDALHTLVTAILTDQRWSESERRELAVAAMHGWAHGWGRNQPRPVLASSHRYGAATVTVVAP